MDTFRFPAEHPPHVAGVYMLKNEKTGQIYVGQADDLGKRFTNWTYYSRNPERASAARMAEAFANSEPGDWIFAVIREMPGSTREERSAVEDALIAKLTAQVGERLLNIRANHTHRGSLPPACAPLTELTLGGKPTTHAIAARVLGIGKKAVAKRLARMRKEGVISVRVEDLPTGRGTYTAP